MINLNVFIVLTLVIYSVFATDDDVVIEPKSSGGKTVALMYAPGCGIGPEAYVPLANAIQSAMAPEYDLWVGIPALPLNVTTLGLKKAFNRVAEELTEAGLPSNHETLYGGHSLGGAVVPMLVAEPEKLPEGFDQPKGMVLMGAFLTRSFKTDAVPEVGPGQYLFDTCPVLTIGAELDGLCRISRIAEARYTQIDLSTDVDKASHYFPVTAIAGMTHMQFASGEIPSTVEDRDLIPEISYDEAHTAVANDFAFFAKAQLGSSSFSKLDSRLGESMTLFQPIIDALNLEGYHEFKPPCYCEAEDEYGGLEYGTCQKQPGCQANCPWTEHSQKIMGLTKGLEINVADSQHIVTEEDPSCHLPHIHDGTDRTTGDKIYNEDPSANPGNGKAPPLCPDYTSCTLNTTTVTQVYYHTGSEMDIWRFSFGFDSADTGYYPISSIELKTKMKSRQAEWQAANETSSQQEDSLDTLDSEAAARCAEINQASIDQALSMVPEHTRSRYEKVGQKYWVSSEDEHVCAAGPCWIWAGLKYKDHGENGVEIISPSFAEPNKNPFPCGESGSNDTDRIPCPAGMHYCKIVSPARVIEWIYTDSLRLDYSLAAISKNEDKCCNKCSEEGTAKYWSIDDIFNQCGEACMKPEDYDDYHKWEKNLLPADSDHPCADAGYPNYKKTTTHGNALIGLEATFDMYTE